MSLQPDNSIGGFLELGLTTYTEFIEEAKFFQSARLAFLAIVIEVKPKRVWLPQYICNSMIDILIKNEIQVEFYSISRSFEVEKDLELNPSELLLYVNYFGLLDDYIVKLLNRFNPSQIILDYSQAFYGQQFNCLATIYSPRKFFGLPDGGMLVTNYEFDEFIYKRDTTSSSRLEHLVGRFFEGPELNYRVYLEAEASLISSEPIRMSLLSRYLLKCINYEESKKIRTENFYYLHNSLSKFNQIKIKGNLTAPLCYPLLPKLLVDKSKFFAEKIYIPSYWVEISERLDSNTYENTLSKFLLPLPCDQRYEKRHLDNIINLIKEELE